MKMKTTGFDIREARKLWELRRDTAARAFNGSLKKFDDEEKESPQGVANMFLAAASALAQIEVAQCRYNLKVEVQVQGKKMLLMDAIKLIEGAARAEKMWRSAAGPVPDRYGSYNGSDERDPTKVVAKATVTPQEAMKLASHTAKRAGALRAAIAVGNTREVELEDLDPALFE
jgi:hypothetical protein